jgi:hypothetical protein
MLPSPQDLLDSTVDTLEILGSDDHILTLNVRELSS